MALRSGQLNAQTWQERQQNSRTDQLQAISRAWDYYEGRHPLPLVVKPNQPDDNAIVNLARPVVDKGIALLFGKEVTWQIDESASTTSTAEQFLKDVWTANRKMTLLQELGQNGALAGLAAIKVNPRPTDKQRPYALINLDPANLQIFASDDDIDDVWRYRIEYTCADSSGGEMHKRQDITRNQGQWIIENYVCRGADLRRQWAGDQAFKKVDEVAWAYTLAPIVHGKNLPCANAIWGYGDLEDVQFNDTINLIVSSTRKILRLHASPQTWLKGQSAAMLRRDANMVWELDEGAELGNLELTSDLESSHKFYQALRSAFFAMGRMPDVSQIGDLGALTNFGLRVLFADALERTATKRNTYGDLLVGVNRLLCLLGGYGDNVTTKLTWADPLPINEAELTTTVQGQQATGLVSNETLTSKLGYDYVDEHARLADEQQQRPAAADVLPGSSGAGAAQQPPPEPLRS